MQLNEHLSKLALCRLGVPCAHGEVADGAEAAVSAAARAGHPVAVKALVPASGRGKAGGILRADGDDEVRAAFSAVTAADIDGLRASRVRIESWAGPHDEYFLAVTLSAEHAGPVVLLSDRGGVDVEAGGDAAVIPLRGDGSVDAAGFRRAAYQRGIGARITERLLGLTVTLAHAYETYDARLIELNPLGVFDGGDILALDARMIVDDNARFRQPWLTGLVRASAPRRDEDLVAERTGLEYLPLPGSIGLVSGGAGMTMTVMDLLAAHGGSAACFLDCSANPTREGYGEALRLIGGNPAVKAVLISVFGGLTLVNKVAENLVALLAADPPAVPVTFRLMGAGVAEAEEVLAAAGYRNHRHLDDAVAAVVARARGVVAR